MHVNGNCVNKNVRGNEGFYSNKKQNPKEEGASLLTTAAMDELKMLAKEVQNWMLLVFEFSNNLVPIIFPYQITTRTGFLLTAFLLPSQLQVQSSGYLTK